MARLELELDGSGIKRGADQAERELVGVKKAADNAEKSLDRLGDQGARDFDRLAQGARRASAAQQALSRQTATQTGVFNRSRGAIQNTAFQVGDFATQVGAGTAASVALGQQLPQLLGGFGALGAVMGAVVAIGVPLAAAFFRNADAADDLESALDRVGEVMDTLQGPMAVLESDLDDLIDKYGGAAAQVREFARVQAEVSIAQGQRRLSDQVEIVGALADEYRRARENGPGMVADLEKIGTKFGLAAQEAERLFLAFVQFDQAQDFASQEAALVRIVDLVQEGQVEIGKLPTELQDAITEMISLQRETAEAERFMQRLASAAGNVTVGDIDALDVFGGNLLPPTIGGPSADTPPPPRLRPSGGGGGISAAEKARQEAESLQRQYDSLISSLDETERATLQYDRAMQVLDDAFAKGVISAEQFGRATDLVQQRLDEALESPVWDKLEGALSDYLFEPWEGGINGMVRSFNDALRRMAADAVASQLTNWVMSLFTGGIGGGNPNSAPRAYDSGGYIPSGTVGIVAESRPEIVNGTAVSMPSVVRGPAQVTGGGATARQVSQMAPAVNIKPVIALSTSDLASEIVKDPNFETAILQIGVRQGWT